MRLCKSVCPDFAVHFSFSVLFYSVLQQFLSVLGEFLNDELFGFGLRYMAKKRVRIVLINFFAGPGKNEYLAQQMKQNERCRFHRGLPHIQRFGNWLAENQIFVL